MRVPVLSAEVERLLIDSAFILFAVTDTTLQLIQANQLYHQTLGKEAASYFEQEKGFEEIAKKLLISSGGKMTLESRLFKWEVSAVTDESQVVQAFVMIAVKQPEKAQTVFEELPDAAILDHVSDAVIVIDTGFTIVYFNYAAESLYHLKRAEVTGKKTDVLKHVFVNTTSELVTAHLFQHNSWMGEAYFTREDDQQEIHLSSAITAINNKQSEVVGYTIINRDITNQRGAYLSLAQSENRIRTALDGTGDNAWEHNFKTGATWFSAINNKFTGYNSKELPEKDNRNRWWQSTHPDDKHLLIQNDKEYRAGRRDSHSLEYRIIHRNGTIKWVLDRGVVIERDDQGIPVRIVGTHTDISKEKELQFELLNQKENKQKEIVEAVIQAQENEREQIANELHEGIAQVLASVKMILNTTAKDPQKIYANLQLANNKISDVVNELRYISQNINTSSLQLMGLLQTVTDIVNEVSATSSIQFTLDAKHYKPELVIDFPVQLAFLRILQEVIRNIIRHSEATEATIELHSSKTFVQLFVRDNGKGFDQKKDKIGLGFKNIISRAEQYNGNVEIVSAPGKGCLLQIILPASAGNKSVNHSVY